MLFLKNLGQLWHAYLSSLGQFCMLQLNSVESALHSYWTLSFACFS